MALQRHSDGAILKFDDDSYEWVVVDGPTCSQTPNWEGNWITKDSYKYVSDFPAPEPDDGDEYDTDWSDWD